MRQYAILLVAVVVLLAGLVARRVLLPNETNHELAARAAAVQVVQAAETLTAAVAAGERKVAVLKAKLDTFTSACKALPSDPAPAEAASKLCAYNESLTQEATAPTLPDSAVQTLQDLVAAVRSGTTGK